MIDQQSPELIQGDKKRYIKDIIDRFNLDELQKLLENENNLKINPDLQSYLLQKVDKVLENVISEIQKNPVYDCTQLLTIIDNQMILEQNWFMDEFQSQEHIINIIRYTDQLIVYNLCFSILINIHNSKQNKDFSKRIEYLIRIFYEHINLLSQSSQQYYLNDYYGFDGNECLQFDIQYYEPSEFDQSYEDLYENKFHQIKVSQECQLKKIQIEDQDQISALNLTRKLLNIQNSLFTPLLDIVKYRIIIKRGLQHDPYKTKTILSLLHFKSIKLMQILNSQSKYQFIIGPFKQYLKLFKIETIEPIVLMEFIQILKSAVCFEKTKGIIIVQLLQDALSMQQPIEYTQGYPLKYDLQIINETCVKNNQIVCCIFECFQQCKMQLKKESQFAITILMYAVNIQDNKLMLPPKQLEKAIKLITILLQEYEFLLETYYDHLQIFYHYIEQGFNLQKPTENGYERILLNELDLIISASIDFIKGFFLKRLSQIDDKQDNQLLVKFLNQIDQILSEQFILTINSSLEFIFSISEQANNKISDILNSNLPNKLNQILLISTKEINPNLIVLFYSIISNNQLRQERFIETGIQLAQDLLNSILKENTNEQAIYDLLDNIIKYSEITNSEVSNTIIEVIDQIYQNQVKFKENCKLQNQQILKFKNIVLKMISHLISNNSNRNHLFNNELQYQIDNFIQIPLFQNVKLQNQNTLKVIKKVNFIINKWEKELGQDLNQVQLLANYKYFKKKQFLQILSQNDFDIASCFAYIFSLINQLNDSILIKISEKLQKEFLLNCCKLLEILVKTENNNECEKKDFCLQKYYVVLMKTFIKFITESYFESLNVEIMQIIISILYQQFQQSTRLFILALKKIQLLLELVLQNGFSNFIKYILQTTFFDYLKNTLQYYKQQVCQNNIHQTQIQEVQQLFLNLIFLFNQIYRENVSQNQQTILQLIQNFQALLKITYDSLHQNISDIKLVLLSQVNNMMDPISREKFLTQNILYFPYTKEISKQQFIGSELFQILSILVKVQLQIQLDFQEIETEIIIHPANQLTKIVLILQYINQLHQFPMEQNNLAKQMLILIEPFLQLKEQSAVEAVNQILLILKKLKINNQIILEAMFKKIIDILESEVQDNNTSLNCIEILIQIFQNKRRLIQKFVLEMKGLETLLKLKGSQVGHLKSLSKLILEIIYDKTLIRASIEAKIKWSIFDQENNKAIKKYNENLSSQQYQNQETYPICLQPVQYNVKNGEKLQLSKNHPTLLGFQKDLIYNNDVDHVMNIIFEDSQKDYWILKKGIQLDTLNSINQNDDQNQQCNFLHNGITQKLFSLLVQQMITSYFESNVEYSFNWKTIIKIIELFIVRFPLLLPQIVRINCSGFLEKYKNKIDFNTSKTSFLSLIISFNTPSLHFIYNLCLDNIVLFKKSNNVIVPFAFQIREMIINELHQGISKSIKNLDKKINYYSKILVRVLLIKSVAKICFKNYKEPDNSFNFIKTYIEGLKHFDLRKLYFFRNQINMIINTLNLLYNTASYLVLEKTIPSNFSQKTANNSKNHFHSISMSEQDRKNQLIYVNTNKGKSWLRDLQINEEVQDHINEQIYILENENISEIYKSLEQNYQLNNNNIEECEEQKIKLRRQNIFKNFWKGLKDSQKYDLKSFYKIQLKNFNGLKNKISEDQNKMLIKKMVLGNIDPFFIKFLKKLMIMDNEISTIKNVQNCFFFFVVYQNYQIINDFIELLEDDNYNQEFINNTQTKFGIIIERINIICQKQICQLKCTYFENLFKIFYQKLLNKDDDLISLFVQNLELFYDQQLKLSIVQTKEILNFLIENQYYKPYQKNLKKFISKLFNNEYVQIKVCITHFLGEESKKFDELFIKQSIQITKIRKGDAFLELFKLIKFMVEDLKNDDDRRNIIQHLEEIFNKQCFIKLWNVLQTFISNKKSHNQQLYGQIILPYLKSVLIIHQVIYQEQESNQSDNDLNLVASQSYSSEFTFETLFKKSSSTEKEFINYLIKGELQKYNNKRLNKFLQYFIQYYPQIIDLSNKKIFFEIKLNEYIPENMNQFDKQQILINRDNIFSDSYEQINQFNEYELKKQFEIVYVNEQGTGEGPAKTWFFDLSKEFVNPNYHLFIPNSTSCRYQIDIESNADPDYVQKFEFIGFIFAKAIQQKKLIYGKFVNSLYKHILGKQITINDLKSTDESEYNIMKQLEGDVTNLELDYSLTDNKFLFEMEQNPGGNYQRVTLQNKKEFIKRRCHQLMTKNIENQIQAIKKGFHSLIPQKCISIFDPNQLEQIVCGEIKIDADDLIKNLKYEIEDNNPIKQWLENVLNNFDQDMLSKFLSFVTGTGIAPINGFSHLSKPIIINIIERNDNSLPNSNTCFNTLYLPEYSSELKLKEKLEMAIREGQSYENP